jgi:hypothetical protein
MLLLAVDSGNVNEWKGRKLEDIFTDGMQYLIVFTESYVYLSLFVTYDMPHYI